MKKLIIIIFNLLIFNTSYSQCNCETIKREDGLKVIQCYPLPVASDNTTQIGLALASNGTNNFITITIRFQNTAKNIIGDLNILLEDNNMITFQLVNAGLSFIGNNEVAQGVFSLSDKQLGKIKLSKLKTINLKLSDGLLRSYKAESNKDILIKQAKCF